MMWARLPLKSAASILIPLLYAAAVYLGLSSLFIPLREHLRARERNASLKLAAAHSLEEKKMEVQSDWEMKKVFLKRGMSGEEIRSGWLRELLAFAQTEGIVLSRLEPAAGDGRHVRLALSFDGEMRRLIHFIYYLEEHDPLAEIESLSINREASSEKNSYELVVAKEIR